MIDSNSKKEEERRRQTANNDGLNTPLIIIDSIVDSTNNSKASQDISHLNDSVSSEDRILDEVADVLVTVKDTIGDLSGNLLEGAAKAAEGVVDMLGGIADLDL